MGMHEHIYIAILSISDNIKSVEICLLKIKKSFFTVQLSNTTNNSTAIGFLKCIIKHSIISNSLKRYSYYVD